MYYFLLAAYNFKPSILVPSASVVRSSVFSGSLLFCSVFFYSFTFNVIFVFFTSFLLFTVIFVIVDPLFKLESLCRYHSTAAAAVAVAALVVVVASLAASVQTVGTDYVRNLYNKFYVHKQNTRTPATLSYSYQYIVR